MHHLPQYPDHAFIPYLPSPSLPPSPSAATSTDLPPITLLNTSTWTYCGPLLAPTPSSLPPSFYTWVSSTVAGPLLPRLLPFLEFLHTFLEQASVQNYWLTIRATQPTNEYNTVRWHTDDIFFDQDGEKARKSLDEAVLSGAKPGQQNSSKAAKKKKKKKKKKKPRYWKLATTLLGPSTLFLADGVQARHMQRAAKTAQSAQRGQHTCTAFTCLSCVDALEATRHMLAAAFEHATVETSGYGTAAFFRLGDEEGAVHSEPVCDRDRIFVNVVPGSAAELAGLMARWGMQFPRSWSFGVPLRFADQGAVAVQLPPSLRAPPPDRRAGLLAAQVPCSRGHGHGESGVREERADEHEDAPSVSTSTMSLNLRDEYTDWLREKGFTFSHIFGQMGGKRESRREDA